MAHPRAYAQCDSRKTAKGFKPSERLFLTNLATGNSNLDPYRPQNEIQTTKIKYR
jgi:hypothetical protein